MPGQVPPDKLGPEQNHREGATDNLLLRGYLREQHSLLVPGFSLSPGCIVRARRDVNQRG